MTASKNLTYDERLTAPKTWWVIAALFGFSMALVFMPFGLIAALRGRVTTGRRVGGDARIARNAV
ncbi:DUF3093 family protein, partial [Streptomyces tendae]